MWFSTCNLIKKYPNRNTRKKEIMKRMLAVFILMLALTACAAPQVRTPEPAATDIPPANMPNPASVYCEQHGNKLEIRTAADGSQSGMCIFPDGSACDEWAYFRGECGPAAQPGPASAKTVMPTQQVNIDATEEQASGGAMPSGATEKISDWWGIIKSTPSGAQYDDFFERQDLGQKLYFGIDALDPPVKSQIEAMRDSGKIVHLYGTLVSNVPDYNGSQIQVDRIVVD
jgi:putative hemolysin